MFQCSKSQLKRDQCAFEAKSITLQTVKDVVLLQSWVQYAGQRSLKELYTLAAQDNNVHCIAYLLKQDESS